MVKTKCTYLSFAPWLWWSWTWTQQLQNWKIFTVGKFWWKFAL